jgi:serine/threonine protein kinase
MYPSSLFFLLNLLDHPHLCHFQHSKVRFDCNDMVREISSPLIINSAKGDLRELMLTTSLNENDLRFIFKQIFEGVKYLHDNGIVHRDLKLDNVVFSRQWPQSGPKSEEDVKIWIIDFGFAVKPHREKLTHPLGSPGYYAPEILAGRSYGSKGSKSFEFCLMN